MKNKFLITLFIALIFNSCSSIDGINPSQNNSLNNITDTNKEKKNGLMQKALDSWLEDEWTPFLEKDKEIKKENSNKKRSFSLQEYVDKAILYRGENNSSIEDSHSKKIKSMPVIGY